MTTPKREPEGDSENREKKESEEPVAEAQPERGRFPNTRWTLVCQMQEATEVSAQRALSALCEMYWYPLYAFARRSGSSGTDAEDLTQGYFEKLLEKGYLSQVSAEKGRLRTFLLTSFRNYTSKRRAYDRRQKRGGGKAHFSIDQDRAERRYAHEPVDHLTPEDVYERHWVLMVMEHAVRVLGRVYEAKGKGELFRALQGSLMPHGAVRTHAEIAVELGMSAGAVKTAASRMRSHYQELLKEQIADTVESRDELRDEVLHLFAVLGTRG